MLPKHKEKKIRVKPRKQKPEQNNAIPRSESLRLDPWFLKYIFRFSYSFLLLSTSIQ